VDRSRTRQLRELRANDIIKLTRAERKLQSASTHLIKDLTRAVRVRLVEENISAPAFHSHYHILLLLSTHPALSWQRQPRR
jgi:hypothetical protein